MRAMEGNPKFNRPPETLEEEHDFVLDRSEYLLEHIAKQDKQLGIEPLTGARRREVLEQALDQSLKRIHEDIGEHRKEGVSLIFIDLDNFKRVNDTYGHVAGDKVLKKISEISKSLIRGTDMISRHGGDEFAVLLPDTNEENAVIIAEKLRSAIDSDDDLKGFRVTASFGVCSSEVSTATDSENFIKHADEASYIAKRAGGNKVEVYTS